MNLCGTSQNGERESTLFKFIEAVHNCPAVRNVSSIADKDTKNKQNKNGGGGEGGWRGQTGFRPNLSISPPLSVSSLLFLCFTTLKKRPCCKLPCLLFDTSLTCEEN